MDTILVTGATGTIGSRTVAALAARGEVEVRAGVRDPDKGAALLGPRVSLTHLDWTEPASVPKALEGVDKAFLITPLSDDQVDSGKRFIDAAQAAGLRQLVKLSTLGAEHEPGILLGRWHREVERHAEASGVPVTILRPGAYMSNFINYTPPDAEGMIYMPLGEGAASFIDPRDVAAVAAAVLCSEGHAGEHYALTGPEALTIADVAAQISEASDRPIRYVDVPESAAREAMLGFGMPAWLTEGLLELYAMMKAGYTATVLDTVERLTGRPTTSFAAFAREHAGAWRRS